MLLARSVRGDLSPFSRREYEVLGNKRHCDGEPSVDFGRLIEFLYIMGKTLPSNEPTLRLAPSSRSPNRGLQAQSPLILR